MNGGTYHRALKAGFDEEKAAFLSHLAIETCDEMREEFDRLVEADMQVHERAKKRLLRAVEGAICLALFVGFTAGLFAARMLA